LKAANLTSILSATKQTGIVSFLQRKENRRGERETEKNYILIEVMQSSQVNE
jgi:hypothetical protein